MPEVASFKFGTCLVTLPANEGVAAGSEGVVNLIQRPRHDTFIDDFFPCTEPLSTPLQHITLSSSYEH